MPNEKNYFYQAKLTACPEYFTSGKSWNFLFSEKYGLRIQGSNII